MYSTKSSKDRQQDGNGRGEDLVAPILECLEGVRQTGSSKWTAICPSHNDNNPSLSIGIGGDGRVLLKCFAGCTCEEICEAIDFPMSSLFPRKDREVWEIPYLTNATFEEVEGASKPQLQPVDMGLLLYRLRELTGGWPRRVNKCLFIDDEFLGVHWFNEPHQLFAWFKGTLGKTVWHNGRGCVTPAELFSELQRTANSYTAIAELPHEPALPDHYYTHKGRIEPDETGALDDIIARFAPDSDEDRELIKAAFVTPGWGGKSGTRPAFLITADEGRGSGKSTLANLVGQLWGGTMIFGSNEDGSKIKTRLLSPDALPKRVALIDNIKSMKFSCAELEALITTPTISGHKMYSGDGERPNVLTWFLTLNGASLSTDMAQRCVIIKLRKPKRSANWEEDIRDHIEQAREKIIADILAFLSSKVRNKLARYSRWASWEKGILQRLEDPNKLQALILQRQETADVEEEEASILETFFSERLQRIGHNPETAMVFLTSQSVADWFNEALNRRETVTCVSRTVKQMITEGRLKRLKANKSNARGRGFLWSGSQSGSSERIRALGKCPK